MVNHLANCCCGSCSCNAIDPIGCYLCLSNHMVLILDRHRPDGERSSYLRLLPRWFLAGGHGRCSRLESIAALPMGEYTTMERKRLGDISIL